ncbi:MAG: LLM class flavin-dependent oxidoreductase [Chitinophagaceae bacterium]|nr:MAG: LLM class flavin-dependent oxidoreductase [Chitinophagaceae bacterium]
MKVGIQLVVSNHEGATDADMFRTEVQLGVEAEAMGFDFVGLVEHHFTDYAMCPDNAQVLSYIAAKTRTLQLMPAAFILPWNNPLRVIEKMVMLDIQSEGRALLGMGRGLSRREFDGFGVDMAESRERFDQAAAIILEGLESGFVEADTPFYKQPRVEVRPRPERGFKGRSYMVGMSPSSVETAAKHGLACLKFSQGNWEESVPDLDSYRSKFKAYQGVEAPPFIIADMVVCFDSEAKVRDYAARHLRRHYETLLDFYEMRGSHFSSMPSYANYAAAADYLNSTDADELFRNYMAANLVGTPEQIVEQHRKRAAIVGDHDLAVTFSYGSMPFADMWEQAKLFADKVLPHLKG